MPRARSFANSSPTLVAAEGKFTKTAEQEAHNCGIPPDAIKQMKAGHENLLKVKESVCSAAPTAGGPPSLSEALGTDKHAARRQREGAWSNAVAFLTR